MIVVVIVLVGGLFFLFRKNIISTTNKLNQTVSQQENAKKEAEKKYVDNLKNLDLALDKARQVDNDLDGLSDEEEKKIGTKMDNPDSDGDGLLDGDEIRFYKSDPLKSDTDGDGFKDGYEVERGYSPVGPGKLKK